MPWTNEPRWGVYRYVQVPVLVQVFVPVQVVVRMNVTGTVNAVLPVEPNLLTPKLPKPPKMPNLGPRVALNCKGKCEDENQFGFPRRNKTSPLPVHENRRKQERRKEQRGATLFHISASSAME